MKTHEELKTEKYNRYKKQIFEELANLENLLILKQALAGEEATLKELNRLNELYNIASGMGYIRSYDYHKTQH